MIILSNQELEQINGNMRNIGDNFVHPKDTYEDRARSLVEIYDQKNVFNNLRIVLKAIRLGTKSGEITIPKSNKFSMDSYLVYLRVLSNLFKDPKYEMVVSETTHIPANNYGVKCMLNYELVDMHKAIKLGATFDDVRLQRVRGERYDQLYYKTETEKIILADKIYKLEHSQILDRFNANLKQIGINLPDAYYQNTVMMMPLIGIKCK